MKRLILVSLILVLMVPVLTQARDWAAKITAVEASGDDVVITFDVMDDSDPRVPKAEAQQIEIGNPGKATKTSIKSRVFDVVKKVKEAFVMAADLSSLVNQTIEID